MILIKMILRGRPASGKTYTADIISNLFPKARVLWIDSSQRTIVGMAREIQKKDYDLIIFDDCKNAKKIKDIQKYVIEDFFKGKANEIKRVLYLTTDTDFKISTDFKIIECTHRY